MTFSNTFRAAGALLAAGLLAAAPASAQDLKIGSPAPALSVEEWLKGEAVASFAPGQIYVVEFWATWCPPCIKSIPHLTELQEKYRGSKLTVIGIAGSERGKQDAGLRTLLVQFITGQGEKMAYTVAWDNDRSMSKAWLEPAGIGTIPTAFIVDGTGTIAWMGNPLAGMDDVLAKVVAGKWDAKAKAELDKKLRPVIEKASSAAEKKEWDAALAALDEGMALGDEAVRQLAWFKYNMHLEKKDFDGAFAFMARGLKGALADEADLLDAVAKKMVEAEWAARFEKKDLALALACSQRASEVSKGKADEPQHLETQAAVHFALGDARQAVEVQTRAVALVKDKAELERLTKKLELYKGSVKG
ncbi:MAG TPA: TlpA disulfide reductase family protein [Planctomycetota bacterium]|nr:TlpA disulfide reductase family protein [Planctomycetota bacterium]